MNCNDFDYYYDVLFTDRRRQNLSDPSTIKKTSDVGMSFADKRTDQSCISGGEEDIKQTIAEIGELLNQIYENSSNSFQLESIEVQQNEGIITEESHLLNETKISDDNLSFETNLKSILKKKFNQEPKSSNIIDTLNSATDKIIEGLQDLTMRVKDNKVFHSPKYLFKCIPNTPKPLQSINQKQENQSNGKIRTVFQFNQKHPKSVEKNTVVNRLYQRQKIKEDKIKQFKADREVFEGQQRQPKTNRQVKYGTQLPLFKRVDQILEEKQKWISQQQKIKATQEEKYYKSLTFQPHLVSSLETELTDQCFMENQKQWQQKKNEHLVNLRLEQEGKFEEPSFRPQICQKSSELLKKNLTSRQYDSNLTNVQLGSKQASESILRNMYPSNRSERGQTVHQFESIKSETQSNRFNSLGRQNKENV